MIEDYDAYGALVPKGYWLLLLNGVANAEGLDKAHAQDEAWKKVKQLAKDGNNRYRQAFD